MDIEPLRRRSFAIAYRMLGTVSEAEDVVQEALRRLSQTPDVENPLALITTITTRLAITELQSARRRRETYVGSWLPEPVVSDDDPAVQLERSDGVSMALLPRFSCREMVRRAVAQPSERSGRAAIAGKSRVGVAKRFTISTFSHSKTRAAS
jgi:RNA polymerase sigma-70 factor (ECF subfamily)